MTRTMRLTLGATAVHITASTVHITASTGHNTASTGHNTASIRIPASTQATPSTRITASEGRSTLARQGKRIATLRLSRQEPRSVGHGQPAATAGRSRAEAGTGTVLTVVLVGALLILLPLALAVVTAVQANQRARAAADLGAIAAAGSFIHGVDATRSCARGADLVTRNRASPAGCLILPDGRTTVTAHVAVDLPILGHRIASASSRAGPILAD